jgi:hypothetical protein
VSFSTPVIQITLSLTQRSDIWMDLYIMASGIKWIITQCDKRPRSDPNFTERPSNKRRDVNLAGSMREFKEAGSHDTTAG